MLEAPTVRVTHASGLSVTMLETHEQTDGDRGGERDAEVKTLR